MIENFERRHDLRKEHEESKEELQKPETRESELSPEIIEKIMEKVQDINATGTPYTRVAFVGSFDSGYEEFKGHLQDLKDGEKPNDSYDRKDQIIRDSINKTSQKGLEYLLEILKFGVLGSKKGGQSAELRKEDIGRFAKVYVDELRDQSAKSDGKSTNPLVHFNIVGRTRTHGEMDSQKTEISQTWWMNTKGGTAIAITFDTASYQEVAPDQDQELKQRTFRVNDPRIRGFYSRAKEHVGENPELILEELKKMKHAEVVFNSDGALAPEDEYGFILSSRISPRFFRGIVINRGSGSLHKASLHDDYEVSADEIATQISPMMIRVYADKQELLLPIYDAQGNLLWPKKMTHEEIKDSFQEQGH